ncbi:carboxymuconolactone decarboxylase family protein [Demequina salsinemoris]|uniref:carboxymuconolactone decarboxylase family protein n=1 Tax=Demequina salsinemoris TaxID=577470 RepID=UPI000782A2D7|nr:carboxymuconolactone decarboxylase family protein [Demequina salsinemoris]
MAHQEHCTDVMAGIWDLRGELPATADAAFELHRATLAGGALPRASKALMALAISIASRCVGCITCHVEGALDSGATPEQVHEAIGVAILMGGGPSATYGAEAAKAVQEYVRTHA